MKLAEDLGLKNLVFVPAQPKASVPKLIASADVCVATLRNIPILRTVYPNKVFDYLASGRPVVLGIEGEIRKVVEAANAGVCVQPGNVEMLASGIMQLYANREEAEACGVRGRAYVKEHFERRRQAEQFADLMQAVITENGRRA
jgi:glycosyltransferase involved in cell wall biosynthesis